MFEKGRYCRHEWDVIRLFTAMITPSCDITFLFGKSSIIDWLR